MGMPLRTERRYTYADYLSWPDNERWELFDGIPCNMSPAPSLKHQRVLRELFRQIANYLVGKSCEVFPAPFDVRLPSKILNGLTINLEEVFIDIPGMS